MAELSPVARALLETIAGPESKGDYNVIYGGSQFDDFTDHPRQPVMIQSGPNKGKYSTAAGKYQFLGSTWDDIADRYDIPDFSPASQDQAAWALATEEYKRDTGRDLEADLAAGDLSQVAPSLRNQWTSLPGGIEQGINGSAFANAYAANLGNVPRLPQIGPAGGPALNAINMAAPTAKPRTGIMAAIGQGLGNALGFAQQQGAPIMRAAGNTAGQVGGNIMRAANPMGTVAGRSAIIDTAIARMMNGTGMGDNMPNRGQSIMTENSGKQTIGERLNGSPKGMTVSNSEWFNSVRGL